MSERADITAITHTQTLMREGSCKLLTPILVLAVICLFAVQAQGQYGGGSGTAAEPYLIYDANQLNAIGANPTDWGKHFKLMADIDFGGSTGTEFNFIGYSGKPFSGVFDGNGHSIYEFEPVDSCVSWLSGLFGYISAKGKVKNLTLVNPRVQCLNSSDYFFGGLLVGILKGRVTNCHVIGGYIEKYFPPWPRNTTYGDIGGLVGYLTEDAVVSECSVKDTTVKGDDAGGVAGYNFGTILDCAVNNINIFGGWRVGGIISKNLGTVERCSAAGVIRAEAYAGGIVGVAAGGPPDSPFDPVVRECYASCSVLSDDNAGGLAGSALNKCLIIDCYATGSVDGQAHTGGLVSCFGNYLGVVPQVVNCYAAASVTGSNRGGLINHTHLDGGPVMVVNSFWDIETSGQAISAGGTGKTTAEMQTMSTFTDAGWDFTTPVWTIDEGVDYPRLWWENAPGGPITIPSYGGGSGEPNDPYLIFDANQMNEIGANSNDWNKHFKLMADIDLGVFTGTSFNIIGERYYDSGWIKNPFTGVFDGSGYTISNFTYTSTGTDFIGLFVYVDGENAEIKDLGLIGPDVDAGTGYYVGSLVGYLVNGTITDCYVEGGSVSGDYLVGGLVGRNRRYGTITNCYSTGSVSGDWGVGGLVGVNGGTITDCYADGDSVSGNSSVGRLVGSNTGTITNCHSSGDVSGDGAAGGLVGSNTGTITNCYATGSVSGYRSVGGLVGTNSSIITNCYSTTSVSGESQVGGLVGSNGIYGPPPPGSGHRYGTISNCHSTGSVEGTTDVGGLVGYDYSGVYTSSFWDNTVNPLLTGIGNTVDPNVIGESTANMQTESTFTDAGWDFTTPVWTIDEGVDYPRLWWEISPVLHAEPEITLGTSNTITWEPVPGANDYYAECAADANFTSILSNTGWITETSYTFTGLQLGRRYWYSVKARNSAGVETGWSNVESSLQGTLADIADAMERMLDPDTLKNKNMKNALLNKINAVQGMIAEGFYADVLDKLQNDILAKMNGCAETGEPDKNDWIITCEGQSVLYPLVIETIEYVKGLMNQ